VAVTPAQIKLYAPEFSKADDALIQIYIDDAPSFIGSNEFGDSYDLAIRLFVCHTLAMVSAGTDASGFDVREQHAGRVGITYGERANFNADLGNTGHGLKLLALMRATLGPAAVAI